MFAANGIAGVSAAVFSPSSLFSNNKGGYWDVAQSHVWSDNGSTQITDGGSVYRIDDLSGNGNHWLQTTSGSRPVWHANSGTPYIQFDGTDDFMTASLPAAITGTNITGAWACRYDTGAPNFGRYLCIVNTTSSSYDNLSSTLFGYNPSGVTTPLYNFVAGPTSTPGADTDFVAQSSMDATNLYLKVDAGTNNSSAHGLTPNLNCANAGLFAEYQAGVNANKGRVYAALIINRVLTSQEASDLATWLGAKQGRSI